MHKDDIRWVANLGLWTALFVVVAGAVFSGYFGEARYYVMTASLLMAFAFVIASATLHLVVWRQEQSKTIRRWEDEGRERLQHMWFPFRGGRDGKGEGSGGSD